MSRYTVRQRKKYRKVLNRYPCGTGKSFNGWTYFAILEETDVFGENTSCFNIHLLKYKTELEDGMERSLVTQQIWSRKGKIRRIRMEKIDKIEEIEEEVVCSNLEHTTQHGEIEGAEKSEELEEDRLKKELFLKEFNEALEGLEIHKPLTREEFEKEWKEFLEARSPSMSLEDTMKIVNQMYYYEFSQLKKKNQKIKRKAERT